MKPSFRHARRAAVVFLIGVTGGCASEQFVYVPGALEDRVDRQSGEVFYPVPKESPKGNARIHSMGIVDLKPKGGGDTIEAILVRLSVSNQDEATWTLNVEEQSIHFPNQGGTGPVFANADTAKLPSISIRPHELRSVDLYFPLPKGMSEAKQLPEFDFRWQIHTSSALVARTTSFTRRQIPEYAYGYPYDPYWASYGWGWGGSGNWWGPPPSSFHYRS